MDLTSKAKWDAKIIEFLSLSEIALRTHGKFDEAVAVQSLAEARRQQLESEGIEIENFFANNEEFGFSSIIESFLKLISK